MITDPISLFAEWFEAASSVAGIDKPNAMTLATEAGGRPSARLVLLSSFDARGFVFHTNYESRKSREIGTNARVALVFWWDPLGRQVRIEGRAETTTATESDAYFVRRPRGSQLGAWASDQSRVIAGREVLEARMQALEREYAQAPVPRPPHWGGFRVVPDAIEFWEHRDNRMHDRLRYTRDTAGAWHVERLAP